MFQDELDNITNQKQDIELKLKDLQLSNQNLDHKDDIRLASTLKEIEKLKYKSYYVRKNGLWNKLTKEQRYDLINKYIDTIEISKDKKEIIIKNININNKELLNIDGIKNNNILQIIPNKKEHKFEKGLLTLLSINT